MFILSHENTSLPAWKVDFYSADTRPNAENLAFHLVYYVLGLHCVISFGLTLCIVNIKSWAYIVLSGTWDYISVVMQRKSDICLFFFLLDAKICL